MFRVVSHVFLVQVVYFFCVVQTGLLTCLLFVVVCFRIFLETFMLNCLRLLCFCLLLRYSGCISRCSGFDKLGAFINCFISSVSSCVMLS